MRAREFMPSRQVAEGGTVKPSGSLDADQWRRQSEKRAKVQRQVKDENQRHTTKVRDLQDRVATG